MDDAALRRFYAAARVAAARVGLSGHVSALLVRFGIPGLMQRIGVPSEPPIEESTLTYHRLHDTLLREHTQQIDAALAGAGVAHFFAKGAALLDRYYRPGERVISDIDLYVPVARRDESVTVLRELGYAVLPDDEQVGPAEMRSTLALVRTANAAIERSTVDLHWALDPVDRLLPRSDNPLPARIWPAVRSASGIALPAPEHHAGILVHHLVHGDLLHVRSLLDLAFLFRDLPDSAGDEYLACAGDLGVRDFAVAVACLVERELGPVPGRVLRAATRSGSSFASGLSLDRWLTLVARTHPDADEPVTLARIRRRLQVLGLRAARPLLADVFFPPRAFLAWRWGGSGVGRAWRRHYRQLVRKALRG